MKVEKQAVYVHNPVYIANRQQIAELDIPSIESLDEVEKLPFTKDQLIEIINRAVRFTLCCEARQKFLSA